MSEELHIIAPAPILRKLEELAKKRDVTVEDLLLIIITEFIEREEADQQ